MAANTKIEGTTGNPERYHYLERRPHPWRRQLYLAGRNMTVAQLIYGMRANKLTPEATAENYELPLAQVREALQYFERHRDIVEQDQEEEKRRLEAWGYAVDAPNLP